MLSFGVPRKATKAVGQPAPSMLGPEARAQSSDAGLAADLSPPPLFFTYGVRSPNALGRRTVAVCVGLKAQPGSLA